MTREDVIKLLNTTPCKYAILTIDVLDDYGVLIYPNEKVIVSVLETQVIHDWIGKAYCVFDSIRDFRVNSVFGVSEARSAYCNYCFGGIHNIEYVY